MLILFVSILSRIQDPDDMLHPHSSILTFSSRNLWKVAKGTEHLQVWFSDKEAKN